MRYRKKPVSIEAYQIPVDPNATARLPGRWVIDAMIEGVINEVTDKPGNYVINTNTGAAFAGPGDWIIKGIEGEIYPCLNSVFQKTYEPEE